MSQKNNKLFRHVTLPQTVVFIASIRITQHLEDFCPRFSHNQGTPHRKLIIGVTWVTRQRIWLLARPKELFGNPSWNRSSCSCPDSPAKGKDGTMYTFLVATWLYPRV